MLDRQKFKTALRVLLGKRSHEVLASELGTSESTLRRLLKGAYPSLNVFIKACAEMDTPMEFFVIMQRKGGKKSG